MIQVHLSAFSHRAFFSRKEYLHLMCLLKYKNSIYKLSFESTSLHLSCEPIWRATENRNCDICNRITDKMDGTHWNSIKLPIDISDWIAGKLDFQV